MATVQLHAIRKWAQDLGDWATRDEVPSSELLLIYLGTPQVKRRGDPQLKNKTLTYEAYNTSVILDFDENGVSTGIEFA